MNSDTDGPFCRVPTLVQLCQRVCVSSIDSIGGLGDDSVRYELVRPILERCDAEQLLRLEEASLHLEKDTQDIWKHLCYSAFPLAIERYSKVYVDGDRAWKNHYFFLKEAEARRLDEASAKLRNQRLEAEERKKEREVKITDRLPPPKRQRTGWGSSPAPKTLFQKTRADASKLQRNMYTRMIPAMPQNGRRPSAIPKNPTANLDFFPPTTASSSSRVTVSNVIRRRPDPTVAASIASSSSPSVATTISPAVAMPRPAVTSSKPIPGAVDKSPNKTPMRDASAPSPAVPRPSKPPNQAKKDPMATLFVPKHRAYSQLP